MKLIEVWQGFTGKWYWKINTDKLPAPWFGSHLDGGAGSKVEAQKAARVALAKARDT